MWSNIMIAIMFVINNFSFFSKWKYMILFLGWIETTPFDISLQAEKAASRKIHLKCIQAEEHFFLDFVYAWNRRVGWSKYVFQNADLYNIPTWNGQTCLG